MTPVDFTKALQADAMTHPGLVRKINEDALGFFLEDGCFFVADGMGGGSAGDIASSLLENQISDVIENSGERSNAERKDLIRTAIHDAHAKIRGYVEARSFDQMGTTLALMLFDPGDLRSAALCHIGDSRIYRLRDGCLTALTSDHTIGAELLEQEMMSRRGDIRLTDHRVSVYSHVLTRAVGAASEPEPDWSETRILPLDRFLICSDGVTTMLAEEEIRKIVSGADRPDEAVRMLAESVLKSGAKDNFSIVIVFVGGPEFFDSDPEETGIYRNNGKE